MDESIKDIICLEDYVYQLASRKALFVVILLMIGVMAGELLSTTRSKHVQKLGVSDKRCKSYSIY